MANRNKLIRLMSRYRVDIKTVAEILGLKPATVKIYRSIGGNNITDKDLELLKYKLKENYIIK